jgi:cysteinyl-tRNA synthetase
LGNFITIEDALKKYLNDDLKLFYLSSHYSSPIDYTGEKMKEASANRVKLQIFLQRIGDVTKRNKGCQLQEEDFVAKREREFEEAMDDDFNTPKALAALFNLVTDVNRFVDDHKGDISDCAGILLYAEEVARTILEKVFGLSIFTVGDLIGIEERDLLEKRLEARKNRDFKRSDELRDILKAKGIVVEDGKEGQTWRRG